MEDKLQLTLESDTFRDMKKDFDGQLQKLLQKMKNRNMNEGKITLSVDVTLEEKEIPVFDGTDDVSQEIQMPKFEHKVTTEVKEKSEVKGALNSEMKLVWDDDTKTYVMAYINNTTQRSIFDDDFNQKEEPEETESVEQKALEGRKVAALPDNQQEDVIDVEAEEVETIADLTYTDVSKMADSEVELMDRMTKLFVKDNMAWFEEDVEARVRNTETAIELVLDEYGKLFLSDVNNDALIIDKDKETATFRYANWESFTTSMEVFAGGISGAYDKLICEKRNEKPDDGYEYDEPEESVC